MYYKLDMDVDHWFLDQDLDVSGMRLMTLLKAYEKAQDAEGEPVFAKAEILAHQLHWSDVKKVSRVSRTLEEKGFLKKVKEGRRVGYILLKKSPRLTGQFNQIIGGDARHPIGGDDRHPLSYIYKKKSLKEDMPSKKLNPLELLEAVQIPIDLQNLEGFPEALDDWLEYKQVEGPTSKAYKGKTGLKSFLTSALTEYRKGTDVVQAIHHAIGSGWQGVQYRPFQNKKSGSAWARSKDETGFLDTVLDRRQKLKVLEGGR